ncbi:hypothetical protein BH20CHL3_BH20CHL3_08390 [soil metagenome]
MDQFTIGKYVTIDVRQSISERIASIAEWRREREQQDMYGLGPEVAVRSRRSADGLRELARHVLALPADDERLTRLTVLAFYGEQFDPGATMLHELGRFRFHDPDVTIEGFFDRMVALAELDHSERDHLGGRQVPGDNPWRPGWLPDEEEDEW